MKSKTREIRVLMADDERDFLEATTAALERRGFVVNCVENGRDALAAIQAETPDVVVLDVKMPGIEGVEVFQRIKRLLPHLPVVMLTGHGSIKQAFETSREGVFEYLTKPCDVEKLALVLRRAVEDRSIEVYEEPFDQEVRLLFVDDETDFVSALSPALERRRIHVTSASNGKDAVAIAATQVFDVALIDVRMPGMDGLTLLRKLQALNQHIEIIVLTGHPSAADAVFGMREGAFDFLTKPQPAEVLAARILAAAKRREKHMQELEKETIDDILDRQPD